ncbi:MAG: hypothetical protein IT455_16065 [Planctomycetes bacterium]|nr:hypothetical protein [Planctomycetota bacterium]
MAVNDALRYLIGALVGAGVTSLVWWPAPPIAAPPPVGVAGPEAPAGPTRGPAPGEAPSRSLLESLAARLQAVEAKLDRVLARGERVPVAEAAPVVIDAEALLRAQQEIERRKLEAMTDEELRQLAWRSYKTNADGAVAVQALELLAQRATDPATRDTARTELATMQRLRGGEAMLAASAQNLRAVIDANGIGSERGVAAAAQLVYTLGAQGQHQAALQQAEAIVGSPAASEWARAELRMTAADLWQQLGDPVRARADYEALLRDLDGKADFAKLATAVRARLGR